MKLQQPSAPWGKPRHWSKSGEVACLHSIQGTCPSNSFLHHYFVLKAHWATQMDATSFPCGLNLEVAATASSVLLGCSLLFRKCFFDYHAMIPLLPVTENSLPSIYKVQPPHYFKGLKTKLQQIRMSFCILTITLKRQKHSNSCGVGFLYSYVQSVKHPEI